MPNESGRRRPAGRARLRPLAAAAALCLAVTGLTPIEYDDYHTYDELTGELRRLADAHRGTASLVSIGRSAEGRDIWALEIAGRGPQPPQERPAVLVVGNLEADRVIGSELALYLADHLLTAGAMDGAVRDRLASTTYYIVPRANPDGAERMFARVKSEFGLTLSAWDADVDGRLDEDGPEDLNGDGLITLMRVPTPGGPYRLDTADPRLLTTADASRGESGAYAVHVEGTDSDGDGFYNEDGPGGVDLNRNFQHAYPYYAPDAGPHMVSEPESRALLDYVLAHRNIGAVLTFGASDNLVGDLGRQGDAPAAAPLAMAGFAAAHVEDARDVGVVERPRSFRGFGGFGGQGRAAGDAAGRRSGGRQPATTVDRSDMPYYAAIAERYRELTGITAVANTRIAEGAFHDYAYFQYGVPAFSTPGWGLDAPAGEGTDARILAWMDEGGIDGFVAWSPFEHPQLGRVEIGGFRPYAASNPPAERIPELGAAHAEFVLHLASLLPRVRIASTSVEDHGGGLYEVTAEIENTGYLPTALAQGVTARAVAPVMIQLDVAPEAVVTGDAKTSFLPSLEGSGGRASYGWLVRGRRGQDVELRVVSQKGGAATTTVTLR